MWVTPSGVQKQLPSLYAKAMSEQPENFRVLERVPLDPANIPIKFREPRESDTTIVVIDCETTGLGRNDSIIELGMVRCRYGESGKLVGVDEALAMLEDPGKPIPPEVTKMTGITDDMVRGQHIDKDRIRDMLRDDPVVVAHNAGFDRPLFEKVFPNDCRWACTMVGIPWAELGHDSYGLGIILEREGWFFDAHRATADCMAVAWLLHVVPGSLAALLAPSVKVMAISAPFEVKDTLKRRGYWWDPGGRYWWRLCDAADTDNELAYLEQFYQASRLAHTRKFDPRTGFR